MASRRRRKGRSAGRCRRGQGRAGTCGGTSGSGPRYFRARMLEWLRPCLPQGFTSSWAPRLVRLSLWRVMEGRPAVRSSARCCHEGLVNLRIRFTPPASDNGRRRNGFRTVAWTGARTTWRRENVEDRRHLDDLVNDRLTQDIRDGLPRHCGAWGQPAICSTSDNLLYVAYSHRPL